MARSAVSIIIKVSKLCGNIDSDNYSSKDALEIGEYCEDLVIRKSQRQMEVEIYIADEESIKAINDIKLGEDPWKKSMRARTDC